MGNYGVALDKKDDPNDGNGIGRVVREIKKDGSYGPIYFIYYNHGFNEKNTDYPYFKKSKDREFVKACQEILDNPLYICLLYTSKTCVEPDKMMVHTPDRMVWLALKMTKYGYLIEAILTA